MKKIPDITDQAQQKALGDLERSITDAERYALTSSQMPGANRKALRVLRLSLLLLGHVLYAVLTGACCNNEEDP